MSHSVLFQLLGDRYKLFYFLISNPRDKLARDEGYLEFELPTNQSATHSFKSVLEYNKYTVYVEIFACTNQHFFQGHPLTANVNTSVNLLYKDKVRIIRGRSAKVSTHVEIFFLEILKESTSVYFYLYCIQ